MLRLGDSQKQTVLALLFAWPAAVGVGWLIGRVTQTSQPIAVCAIGWLGLLFWTLRSYLASSESR